MLKITKKTYLYYVITMIIVTSYLPIVANNLPRFIGSFHFWAPLFILSLFFFETSLLIQKAVIQLVIIGLLITLIFPAMIWPNLTDWNKNHINQEFYYMIIAITMYWYFVKNNDFEGLAKVVRMSLIFILITSITSIYASYINPMYARNMLGNAFSASESNYFRKIGGASYSFATAIVAISPMLIYYYKNRVLKYSKKLLIVYGLIILITLIRMQIFANLLLAILIFIFAFFGQNKIKQSSGIAIIIILFGIMIPNTTYSKFFKYSSSYFNQGSEMNYKMNDMSLYLAQSNVRTIGTLNRLSRYKSLSKAFFKSPIFGTGYSAENYYDQEGAHLFWMNRLTIWGILGFILYLQIHIFNLKKNVNFFFKTNFLFYYLLSISSILALGLMKSLNGRQTWIMYFFIIPSVYYLPILYSKKK